MLDPHRLYTERLGLLSVVVLSNEARTVKDRLQIIEEIVCFKNLKPYFMKVKWVENRRLGFNYKIEKSKQISEEEYEKLKNTPLL